MFDFLNPLGLPFKYAILLGVAAPIGVLIANILGISEFDFVSLISTAIGGAIGGLVGGYIRHRTGKAR